MIPTPIDQDSIYYKPPWNQSLESLVLFELQRELSKGRWEAGALCKNEAHLEGFHKKLTRKPYYFTFTLEELARKLREWERRYQRFNDLVEHPLAKFHDDTNRISATEWGWKQLAQERPIWRAYMLHGEDNWKALVRLFKDPTASSDTEDGVSATSSTIESVLDAGWGPNVSSGSGGHDSGGEEVTQPMRGL